MSKKLFISILFFITILLISSACFANDIDLITFNQRTQQYGLNPILSCEKGQLKKKYNIDVDIMEKGGFSKW